MSPIYENTTFGKVFSKILTFNSVSIFDGVFHIKKVLRFLFFFIVYSKRKNLILPVIWKIFFGIQIFRF
ncbi:hypothetical protein LEP1GSC007_2684 [Leptospira interrogans serovar Bulgarica str. Mallika]|nr:hypothetical protein LEP1GSC007_2684 [Leptospira interrogans serovar Bulgarica str. Mallika]